SGENAFGRFYVIGIEAQAGGELEPALYAALAADVAVMIGDAVPPFDARGAVAEARDDHGVLYGDGALVVIAVERPGLHLPLVELAAMKQAVEGVQAVIARGADVAELGFEFVCRIKRGVGGNGEGRHGVHRVISIPSAGMVHPAASSARLSSESGLRAGFELLM